MDRLEFYILVFNNLELFFICVFFVSYLYYLLLKDKQTAGLLDSSFFYGVFTFGTSHAIVLFLCVLGYVEYRFLYFTIFSFVLFCLLSSEFIKYFKNNYGQIKLLSYASNKSLIFIIWSLLLIGFSLYLILYVGAGAFAEINRFEQNSGSGVFVRIFIVLRLLFLSYLAIIYKTTGGRVKRSFIGLAFVSVCFITSLIDGAKFALIESFIVGAMAWSFYTGYNLKLKKRSILLFGVLGVGFAVALYQINLTANNKANKEAEFIKGVPFVVEAIGLRVLANGDKYFLSLPNNVIDTITSYPMYIRLTGAIASSTFVSGIYGENINNYSIGKQILYHHDPNFDSAGGPTSHFDLYAYKHLGYLSIIIPVVYSIWFSFLFSLRCRVSNNIYLSVFLAILIHRSWSLFIEPPLGFGYIFDVIIIYLCFSCFRILLRK